MRFGILGPLQVQHEWALVDIGRPKQRTLLALLLIHANSVVSVDKLVEDLWDGDPPDDSSSALQVQVSRLRRVLAGGVGGRIAVAARGAGSALLESRKPGYVLHVGPGELDAQRFERLVDEGRRALAQSRLEEAAGRFAQGLALWRGPALAEFAAAPFAMPEATRLEELRLSAIEERIEAELGLGRHGSLVGELRQLSADHPLREGLWGQLMVALYRCGRQAEALRTYGELRRRLGDELGIEPSVSLQRLEEAVLLQKPVLDWSPPPFGGATAANAHAPKQASPPPVEGDHFVGRRAELDQLVAEWERALEDGPRLVVVSGEPGVGKSRLAAELARVAQSRGATVLVGHCDEELAVPYQPFAEVLGSTARDLPPDELQRWLDRRGNELVRLVPELADVAGDLAPPVPSDPETERYRLFEAVRRTFIALCELGPVVLVLDDLHWAARPTLLLLRHLILRADPMRLLAIGTLRDTELPSGTGAGDPLGDLGRSGRFSRLALVGLAEDEVAELLGAHASLARSVHASTAGNPLFVAEVARSLCDSGAGPLSMADIGVPESVRGVVRRRLSSLPEVSRRLLRVAAVIGTRYDVGVLQEAARIDEDTVLSGLEDVLTSGLAVEEPGPALRQRFTHSLVRAAIYDDLSAARRAQLHRRIGEAIEAVFAGRLPEHLPALAHHFSEAAGIGGADKAIGYSTGAGDRALAQLAHDEAASHYQRALRLLGAADGADGLRRRCDLLLRLGEAQRRCGAPAHRETLLEAAGLARRLGDADRLADAALANNRGFWSATGRVDAERVETLQAALDALPGEDSALRARLLAHLAVELVYSGDTEGVRRRSDEAIDAARRLGDLTTLAGVLAPRYNTLRGDPGTLRERLSDTAELLAVAEQLPDPALRCQAWGWRAIAALEAADRAESDRCFEVFIRLAGELQQPTMLWYSTYLRASRETHAGRFDTAERLSTEAFRLGVAAGHGDAKMFHATQQLQLAYERGTLAAWEQPLAAAMERQPAARWLLRTWQALLLAESDRDEEARRVFEELASKDFADFTFEPSWLYVLTSCALVCAHLGDQRRAVTLIDLIGPYDGQMVTLSSLAYTGSVSHYLGVLWRTAGERDTAERCFAHAIEAHQRMGGPVWLARTRLEWAALLLEPGTPDRSPEAVALLEAALATASELGAAGVERRAAALLDRAHGPTVSS